MGLSSLYELLDYFQKAYALFAIPLYTFSEKRRRTNPKKLYAVDPGVLRACSIKPGFDRGASLEIATFVELRRRGDEIFYYHTARGS